MYVCMYALGKVVGKDRSYTSDDTQKVFYRANELHLCKVHTIVENISIEPENSVEYLILVKG